MLDLSAWEATDIVVATEAGLAEGKLSVLEAWKGGLVAKDALVIPELRRFADEGSRTIKPDPWLSKKEDKRKRQRIASGYRRPISAAGPGCSPL
jgi:hypothetical protein